MALVSRFEFEIGVEPHNFSFCKKKKWLAILEKNGIPRDSSSVAFDT